MEIPGTLSWGGSHSQPDRKGARSQDEADGICFIERPHHPPCVLYLVILPPWRGVGVGVVPLPDWPVPTSKRIAGESDTAIGD